ncbi:ankyrin repeat domain-containing protein [bacterium]|nr:ankyrin repeat domain-containing protein [bacterium]
MKQFFSLFLIFFLFSVFAEDVNESFSAAVQAGNVKAAADFFAKGADINFVDEEWPLFVTAVTSNDVKMAEFFIKNGVNLELKGPDGKTALLHAISLKNTQLVSMLITAGADLKAEDLNGKNALMYAAEANNAELMHKLLKSGFSEKTKSKAGKTALDYAIDARAQETYRILSKKNTLPMDFINAVEKGDAKAVKTLISEGADVKTKDKNGKAAIVIATEKGYAEVLKLILENGADPNGKYFKNPKANLFILSMHNSHFDAALVLLKSGVATDFNHKFQGGKTALMIAIETGKNDLTTYLLLKKFNVDATDDFGNTALIYAVKHDLFSVAKKLLELGADPTLRQVDGKTALDIAKSENKSSMVRILTEAEKNWK